MIVLLWSLAVAVGLAAVVVTTILAGSVEAFFCSFVCVAAGLIGFGIALNYGFSVQPRLAAHLRTALAKATEVHESVDIGFRVDLYRALEHFRQAVDKPLPLLGVSMPQYGIRNNERSQPLLWESLPISASEKAMFVTNGIYRLVHAGKPFVAMVTPRNGQFGLLVIAADDETAKSASAAVLSWARRNSIYRGQVIALEESHLDNLDIRFFDLAPVPREQIILPEEVLSVVERNVLGLLAHAETLRKAGRGTRHGVLFHGPPGTGKTLVTRYLARACPDYTAIVLTGRNLSLVRQSCRLARLLSPSIVILEDVDLVAVERRENFHAPILHDLLEEMDGLGRKTDCIFLLTTNRPEVLEPALASRPGRVDQAIYFPLPDVECRRRLFSLFSEGLATGAIDWEMLLDRTEGASPAFLQELFRKATLLAAERGERELPLRLTNEDFDGALDELVRFGGELTRNLLGFQPRLGFRAAREVEAE